MKTFIVSMILIIGVLCYSISSSFIKKEPIILGNVKCIQVVDKKEITFQLEITLVDNNILLSTGTTYLISSNLDNFRSTIKKFIEINESSKRSDANSTGVIGEENDMFIKFMDNQTNTGAVTFVFIDGDNKKMLRCMIIDPDEIPSFSNINIKIKPPPTLIAEDEVIHISEMLAKLK